MPRRDYDYFLDEKDARKRRPRSEYPTKDDYRRALTMFQNGELADMSAVADYLGVTPTSVKAVVDGVNHPGLADEFPNLPVKRCNRIDKKAFMSLAPQVISKQKTMKWLAFELGISYVTVSRIFSGEYRSEWQDELEEMYAR